MSASGRDHAAPESTLALSKADQPCCGRVRPLAWCSRPRNSAALLEGALVASVTRNRKSPRRQRLEAAINYPIDWLEERSGLIGGIRYFLFRKVPSDTDWFHTLGSATLTAFLVQALTGV